LIDLVIDYGQDAVHWTSFGEQAFSFALSPEQFRSSVFCCCGSVDLEFTTWQSSQPSTSQQV